jgi:hypothetical protein
MTYALALPSHVPLHRMKGYTLSVAKQVLTGRMDAVIKAMEDNISLDEYRYAAISGPSLTLGARIGAPTVGFRTDWDEFLESSSHGNLVLEKLRRSKGYSYRSACVGALSSRSTPKPIASPIAVPTRVTTPPGCGAGCGRRSAQCSRISEA